jgi:Flp pilus assembly protein CpaB
LIGILLMLVATGGSIAVWSTEQDTRSVLVLARELPAGATLTSSDLNVTRARLDDGVYRAAVPASQLNATIGKQLSEPAHVNQILSTAQISTRPRLAEDQMVFAIPVRTDAAAGGRIRAGDAVQVIGTGGRGESGSRVVVARATVYDVGRDQPSGISSASSQSSALSGPVAWITLILTQDQALQLAQARWGGELDVALLPAAP